MPLETLRDLWERNARLHPNKLVAVDDQRQLTYKALLTRAVQLANALKVSGIQRGDRVAILSMNRIEYLEVLAANHLLGSVANTLNFRLAGPELEWILGDSTPRVLLFETQFTDTIAALRPALTTVECFIAIGNAQEVIEWGEPYEAFLLQGSTELPAECLAAEDIAHLIYTSGTTGRPKGVMRSHRCEMNMAEGLACGMDARPQSRMLEVMPLFHTGAQSSAFATMWRGGTVYIHAAFDAETILRSVEQKRLTHLHLVPLMIQDLLDVPNIARFDLSSLDTILYAAAPITPAVLRRGLDQFGQIFIGAWGMTEGGSTFLPKADHRADATAQESSRLSSIGQEAQHADIRIVDAAGNDCAVGEAGELLLQSGALMSGYWNNVKATAETVRDGWLRTGDMGYFDEQHYIYLVDRKKDMIISGGENIYSQEVERALAEHHDVDRVAVIGVPDERWGEAVKAIIVLRAGATATAADIIDHCGKHIANYKKPRSVEFVDVLPVLASGKINKVALRQQFLAEQV